MSIIFTACLHSLNTHTAVFCLHILPIFLLPNLAPILCSASVKIPNLFSLCSKDITCFCEWAQSLYANPSGCWDIHAFSHCSGSKHWARVLNILLAFIKCLFFVCFCMFSRYHFQILFLLRRTCSQPKHLVQSLHHGAPQDGERPLWKKGRGGWVCFKVLVKISIIILKISESRDATWSSFRLSHHLTLSTIKHSSLHVDLKTNFIVKLSRREKY